jgi:hypothetical protein
MGRQARRRLLSLCDAATLGDGFPEENAAARCSALMTSAGSEL